MIAFGCSVSATDVYARCAQVGLALASEPDSRVFAYSMSRTVPGTYNLVLDRAAASAELEALVLVREDVEIVDPDFCTKLRGAFADREVAVVGCVGATGVESIAWWDGSITSASFSHRYPEFGGGELARPRDAENAAPAPAQVDTVGGVLLALSPWAVRNLRFDEAIGPAYGYDFDICAQARTSGRKVLVADLRIAQHHSLDLVTDEEQFRSAHVRAAEKWDRRELSEAGWRARARAAEADAGAARLLAASTELEADARASLQDAQLDAIRASRSWRLTEPLRIGNALARGARARLRR